MLIKLSSPFFPPRLQEFTLLFVCKDNINLESTWSTLEVELQ